MARLHFSAHMAGARACLLGGLTNVAAVCVQFQSHQQGEAQAPADAAAQKSHTVDRAAAVKEAMQHAWSG